MNIRASVICQGPEESCLYLPVWSADGVHWRPVVMTRSVDENPKEFIYSMGYRTSDEAFEVAKRFCQAISYAVWIDKEAKAVPADTIIYVSGETSQLKLVSDAYVKVVPEKPDDGKRDSIA